MNKTIQHDYGFVDAETKAWDYLQYQASRTAFQFTIGIHTI